MLDAGLGSKRRGVRAAKGYCELRLESRRLPTSPASRNKARGIGHERNALMPARLLVTAPRSLRFHIEEPAAVEDQRQRTAGHRANERRRPALRHRELDLVICDDVGARDHRVL